MVMLACALILFNTVAVTLVIVKQVLIAREKDASRIRAREVISATYWYDKVDPAWKAIKTLVTILAVTISWMLANMWVFMEYLPSEISQYIIPVFVTGMIYVTSTILTQFLQFYNKFHEK